MPGKAPAGRRAAPSVGHSEGPGGAAGRPGKKKEKAAGGRPSGGAGIQ